MTVTYNQTTATVTGTFPNRFWIHQCDPSGGPGVASASVTAVSAGGGVQLWQLYNTSNGAADATVSIAGVFVLRMHITTANTNLTWSQMRYSVNCGDTGDTEVTNTGSLAISLGTTGNKTATATVTNTFTLPCGTASAQDRLYVFGSSISTMVGVFTAVPDLTIDLPYVAAPAPPAPTAMGVLAQLGAGV